MTQNIITAGAASDKLSHQGGDDGTLVIKVGPSGSKVDAISIASTGKVLFPTNPTPGFSAFSAVNRTIFTGVAQRQVFDVKEFDLTNAFDSTTNSRFQPLVAGYYQINFKGDAQDNSTGGVTLRSFIYKNGAAISSVASRDTSGQRVNLSQSRIVFLNGSTDYVEIYASTDGIGNATIFGAATGYNFSAFLLKAI